MAEKIRDHLANERTFLAWIRTALGMIGLGFVLARMGLFLKQLALMATSEKMAGAKLGQRLHSGQEFILSGIVFLAIGTVLGGWSARVYDRNRRAIDSDRFEAAGKSVIALGVLVFVGGLIIVGLVVWQMLYEG